jgi:hypothetical protein
VLAGCRSASHAERASTPQLAPQTVRDDAVAKAVVRTAEVAAEAIAVDANGSYSGVNVRAIHQIEPSVPTQPGGAGYLRRATGTHDTYALTAVSASGGTFTIVRRGDGVIVRTCSGGNSSSCQGGRW